MQRAGDTRHRLDAGFDYSCPDPLADQQCMRTCPAQRPAAGCLAEYGGGCLADVGPGLATWAQAVRRIEGDGITRHHGHETRRPRRNGIRKRSSEVSLFELRAVLAQPKEACNPLQRIGVSEKLQFLGHLAVLNIVNWGGARKDTELRRPDESPGTTAEVDAVFQSVDSSRRKAVIDFNASPSPTSQLSVTRWP